MRLKTGLLLLPLVLFGTAGCGDENTPKACDGVVCGAHASCTESTGACACEAGYSGDATAGCTEDAKCTETTCSGHGSCSVQNGTPVCACNENFAGDNCDRCTTDYVLEGGACINTKQVDCIAPSPVPAHAQVVSAKVEITYSTATGWSTAAACAVECEEGYVADGTDGACINSKEVACIAPTTLPAHAHSVSATVTVDYVDGEWETAATCQTACDAGYVGEGTDGACINSKEVACIAPTTLPANAHSISATVTVNYVDGKWETAATCQTACNDDYVAEVAGGDCINSKEVHCAAPTAIPENGHSVDAVHTITYADGNWSTIPTCQIECNTGWAGEGCVACDVANGYAELEGGCVLDACAAEPCVYGSCANTSTGFTCSCDPTYGGTTCDACAADHVAVGEASPLTCVENLCAETTCGANATCSMVAAGQTACTCVSGYTLDGEACINEKMMACDEALVPANSVATQAEKLAKWVDGAWVKAACDWTCAAGFHAVADACVANVAITSCYVWPDTFTGLTGASVPFNGVVQTALTAGTQGQAPGLDGRFCYSTAAITVDTPASELTCVDAAFVRETNEGADDEYEALVKFTAAGSFNYVFYFSGDGKASWSLCNTSTGVNGVATLTEPPGSLIFSEYVEGGSSNKAIEIFNATGAEKDVTGCTIELYTNGSPTAATNNTFTFPDGLKLPVNGTYAICNASAVQALKDLCDTTHGVTSFNGNDALVLKCGGEVLDVFGQVGFNPGDNIGWGTTPDTTLDHTLRRACSVHFGDTVGSDAFVPADQWEFFAKDTFAGIGEHCPVVTNACNPDPCNGKGTCSLAETAAGFTCACNTGYAGDTCDACDTDYIDEGAGCINTKQVACIPPETLPANSQSVDAQVTVIYSNGGWATAATCATECIAGYVLDGGACINEKSVHCLPPENIPANMHSVDTMVTVTYTDGAWTTADTCATACDAGYLGETCSTCDEANGYTDIGGGICATDNCGADPCKNGGLCTSTSEGYTCECAPTFGGATCEECAGGFVALSESPLSCVADLCVGNPCVNGTCSMASATAYACVCADGYTFEGGSCINTMKVACTDAAPANATSTTAQVDVTWTGTAWSTPADCAWTCDSGYDLVGTECLNQQTVACAAPATIPENAHSVTANVTITFDGTNWTTPADCAWVCNDNFHLSGTACVANVNIGWCNVQDPKEFTEPVGYDDVFYGRFWSQESEATVGAKAPGVDAKFCYGVGPITAETDLSTLTCEIAEFNVEVGNDDEYQALVQFNTAGAYDYVYAFSGDGQKTWKICDADDRDTDWAAGKATVLAPFDMVSAAATSATTVTVTFNRAVKADTVLIDGTQFEIFSADLTSQLAVKTASVDGSVVTLTTDAQTAGTEYTVAVEDTVKDVALVTAVPVTAEASFVGYTAPVPVALVTATALSNTSVMLTFDKALDASTVIAGDFTITPELAVTEVVVAGGNVTLTTASQAEVKYTVTVGDVLATDGSAIDPAANSLEFDGMPAVVAVMPVNGGFEDWTAGKPNGWTGGSAVGVEQETAVFHGGSASVKLTRNVDNNANTEFASEYFPVTAGSAYRISIWFLDNNVNARANVGFAWLSDTGVRSATLPTTYTANSPDWTEYTNTTPVAPPGTVSLQVITRIYKDAGTATGGFVYMDDVTVTAQ